MFCRQITYFVRPFFSLLPRSMYVFCFRIQMALKVVGSTAGGYFVLNVGCIVS